MTPKALSRGHPPCGKDRDTVWCYCGKCKQVDYPLPKDFISVTLTRENN